MRTRTIALLAARVVIVAGAVALARLPSSSQWIEHHYSEALYPFLQHLITPVSNVLPFAVFDLLVAGTILGVVVWWIASIRRAGQGRRVRALGLLFLNTVVLGAGFFLLFELTWGLNYLRVPISERLDYDRTRVTREALDRLAVADIERLNAESPPAHAVAWPATKEWANRLIPSFDAVIKATGNPRGMTPGRVKTSIFNLYMSASGIEGFTDPLALEVILDSRLLPFEQPFALAHEWAHLAGFADESEANFIALLTCIRSNDAGVRYSGWLELYLSLPPRRPPVSSTALEPEHDRHAGLEAKQPPANSSASPGTPQAGAPVEISGPRLDAQVIADLKAVAERRQKEVKPWVSDAEWRIYDKFLKANGVQAGVASYGLFIRLMLGTKFDPGWTPAMRSGAGPKPVQSSSF